jgi:hypothetical protein
LEGSAFPFLVANGVISEKRLSELMNRYVLQALLVANL